MKDTMMKSTHMFRDQVDVVSSWFSLWNECEQTVALYSLLRKVSAVQAKFLLQVIDQTLASSPDVMPLERQANDAAYISSLCAESKEDAVSCLLSCLPLLQAGNMEAKAEYLKIIPKILAHSLEKGCHIEESRQLLSYTLIHPAVSAEERTQLKLWQRYLEDCYSPVVPHQQWTSDAAPGFVNKNGHQRVLSVPNVNSMLSSSSSVSGRTTVCNRAHQMSLASSDSGVVLHDPQSRLAVAANITNSGACEDSAKMSGTDGVKNNEDNFANVAGHHKHLALHATHSGPPGLTPPTTPGTCNNVHRKLTRSASVAPSMTSTPALIVSEWLKSQQDTRPLSPQSSVTSSGSGSDTPHPDECGLHDRNTFLEEGSGMREVPIWLKTLRLHKYASLFQQLTYDDMMSLTEEWLDILGVTKGARHKIVLNVARLKERQNVLRAMEKDVMDGGNMKQALSEIKAMLLNTPIRSYPAKSDIEPTTAESANQNTSNDDAKSDSSKVEQERMTSPPTITEGDSIAEGDLPGQLTRIMGKLCTQLLVTAWPEDNCFAMYLQLLDKCLLHEAFTIEQQKRLLLWRQQTQKILHLVPQRCGIDHQHTSFNNPLAMSYLARMHRPLRGQIQPVGPVQQPPMWAFGGSVHSVAMGGIPSSTVTGMYTAHMKDDFSALPYPFQHPSKRVVGRTQSAPNKSSPLSVIPRHVSDVAEPDINARLDSLCLSMTEHALGSFDGPDRGSTF